MARDPLAALETLIQLGVHRVLTSGQERSAIEGLVCELFILFVLSSHMHAIGSHQTTHRSSWE